MQSSVLSSIGFDDDEDDNYVVSSSSNCWRYSGGEDQEEPGQTSVKKEVAEEDEIRPIIKSTSTRPSVGCVSTIKNKSKTESEYSANAVKKVNDLLRGSELSQGEEDEAEYTNRLIIPQRPQEQVSSNRNNQRPVTNFPQHYSSQSVPNRVTQEPTQTSQYVPATAPKQPTQASQYAPTRASEDLPLANQYIPTHVIEDISQSSVPGTSQSSTSNPSARKLPSPTLGYQEPDHMIQNQAGNSIYQDIEQEEQVIKLIHTSDATLPYMCSACNMHSSNLGVMKQHIADHKKGIIKCPLLGLSKNVFICPFGNCEFSSPNYARVLTHLNRFHGSAAQHLIKQITSATLPDAVEALKDPVAPLSKRESIWKEVGPFQKKPQSKLYACSECDYKDYDFKTVIQHLQGHVNANKKQKTG